MFVSLVEKSFFYCHLFDVKYVVDAVFAQNKSRISDKWVFRDILKSSIFYCSDGDGTENQKATYPDNKSPV